MRKGSEFSTTLRMGVSSCLLGNKVRYDGKDKLNPFLVQNLGSYAELRPLCPEVGAGLPVPRDPLRVVAEGNKLRLVEISTGKDRTRELKRWIKNCLKEIAGKDFHGFILKANSPSCALRSAERYNPTARRVTKGAGIFAEALKKAFPIIPVEEAETLEKPGQLSNFADRVFVLKRFRELLKGRRSKNNLRDFHRRNRLIIASHSLYKIKDLERILNSDLPQATCCKLYQQKLLETLRLEATRRKHLSVIQEILRSLRKDLGERQLKELRKTINGYKEGRKKLYAPLNHLRKLIEILKRRDLMDQLYLFCDSAEFYLRGTL